MNFQNGSARAMISSILRFTICRMIYVCANKSIHTKNSIVIRMAGIPEDDEMMPSCVDDVRASIDLDGDGDITKEEFVRNALKNDFISKLLKYETDISEN